MHSIFVCVSTEPLWFEGPSVVQCFAMHYLRQDALQRHSGGVFLRVSGLGDVARSVAASFSAPFAVVDGLYQYIGLKFETVTLDRRPLSLSGGDEKPCPRIHTIPTYGCTHFKWQSFRALF